MEKEKRKKKRFIIIISIIIIVFLLIISSLLILKLVGDEKDWGYIGIKTVLKYENTTIGKDALIEKLESHTNFSAQEWYGGNRRFDFSSNDDDIACTIEIDPFTSLAGPIEIEFHYYSKSIIWGETEAEADRNSEDRFQKDKIIANQTIELLNIDLRNLLGNNTNPYVLQKDIQEIYRNVIVID